MTLPGIDRLAERFWKYVQKTDGCWLWTGAKTNGGYGSLAITKGRSRQATWVSWFLAHGAWPADGQVVMHSCDVRACVRPDHLSVGTQQANIDDKMAKGHHRHGILNGERNGLHKLTAVQVTEIRRRHADHALGYVLARDFGVSGALISQIVRNRIWREVAA